MAGTPSSAGLTPAGVPTPPEATPPPPDGGAAGPPVVALTGSIGAGKSTVAAMLAARGAAIVDADLLAREAVAPGTPGLAAVLARFGPTVRASDGSLDRAALRRLVFGDAEARRALEAIVHPDVARRRDAAVAVARASGAPVVVCDIPLLFEAGLDAAFDRIVVVDAPEAVRLARLVRDRGLPPAEAQAMLDAQAPASGKRARAWRVLENGGTRKALAAQVDALWPALVTRS